jgi:hypothetical protein
MVRSGSGVNVRVGTTMGVGRAHFSVLIWAICR